MKFHTGICRFSLMLLFILSRASWLYGEQELLQTDRFGVIEILRPQGEAEQVALWLRGRNEGIETTRVKEALLRQRFVLAIIDADAYLETLRKSGACSQFGEIIRLGQVVQNRLALEHLLKPALFGSGSGAALAYASMLDAEDQFSGLITEEFCSEVADLAPFCDSRLQPQNGGKILSFPGRPPVELRGIVFKGAPSHLQCGQKIKPFIFDHAPRMHQVLVTEPSLNQFAGELAEVFPRPKKNSLPVSAGDAALLADLDLVELPADPPGRRLIIFFSGDGGWAAIDKVLGSYFQERGINVVGLSSLRYFWKEKTPEETATMLAAVVGHYSEKWHTPEILLAGFSLGADVLPSAYNRLPEAVKAAVDGMILLNPEKRISFEVKLTDWLHIDSGEGLDGLPEILKIKIPLICVYGETELKDTLCTQLPPGNAQVIQLKGGHHFDGDYHSLGARLLELTRPISG